MATIELVDVAHRYGKNGTYAVQDINLKWGHGISSALLGPSGCGKTTLLKIISGLLQPTEGRVLIDGRDVTRESPKARNIAQVFQFPVIYETLTVYDNLAFPLVNRNVPMQAIRARVHEVAEMLDLTAQLGRSAAALGTAEKQLISLGRGIVREDLTAVLLDEPLTVIDPHQKWYLRRKLKQLQQRLGITMIYVTHDQHEALTFAEQVTVMNQGAVLQTGTPQALHDEPQTPFVGYFIGSPGMNLFDAALRDGQVCAGDYCLPLPERVEREIAGHDLKLGIRPEFIGVYSQPYQSSIACAARAIHHTGSAKILDLVGAGLSFKARVTDTFSVQTGDQVWAHFPRSRTMIYVDGKAIVIPETEQTA
jgi:glycerol transport system ATP-binding protein